MNKLSLTLLTALFAAGAYGQSPAPAAANVEKSNATAGSVAEAEARTTKDLLTSRNCVRDTGTHITRKGKDKDDCVNTTGRSYDKKNFDQTSTMETDKVLPLLDPAIDVRRK
jgi:hypothetical protein